MKMEKTKDKVIFDGDPNLKNCGHYKKDTPHKDIGLQKFRIPVRLIVDANFIIVSKDLPRAKELLQKRNELLSKRGELLQKRNELLQTQSELMQKRTELLQKLKYFS